MNSTCTRSSDSPPGAHLRHDLTLPRKLRLKLPDFLARKFRVYVAVFVFFLSGATAFAQTEEIPVKPEIPEGMEEIQLGGSAKLIVPQGAKTKKVGAQIIVEGTKEYMARRFVALDKRLDALEESQKEMTAAIDALQKTLQNRDKEGIEQRLKAFEESQNAIMSEIQALKESLKTQRNSKKTDQTQTKNK